MGRLLADSAEGSTEVTQMKQKHLSKNLLPSDQNILTQLTPTVDLPSAKEQCGK